MSRRWMWRGTRPELVNGKDWGLRKGLLMWVVTKERGVWAISVMHNMDLPLEPPKAW